MENFTFLGEEEISIEILRQTDSITLHSVELEILKAEIMQGRKILPAKVFYNTKEETVNFKFAEKISEGEAALKISFKGILNDKMRGFYRSKYYLDGKIHHMGVTQFESTDARRAIPCFDEPTLKAVFEVSLKIPSDRTAISNTLESEIIEHESGFKTVRFTPSPEMSSYLLAFIVGHFEYIEKKTKEGVLVRVFVTPGKLKQAEFALDVAARTISFYSNYFGIPYPLPVLDLIAIPDFAAGAMENWGLLHTEKLLFLSIRWKLQHITNNGLPWSLRMNWRINGLETWSQWSGGLIYGLMKGSPLIWSMLLLINYFRSGKYGRSLFSSSRAEGFL